MNEAIAGTLPGAGLSSREAADRLRALGSEKLPASRSTASIVAANVFTLFNAIIGGFFILILSLGLWADAIFGLIAIVNTWIGIRQELKAKAVLDRLAVLVAPRAQVIRDGETVELRAGQVVPGDLVRVVPGDQLVADGVTVSSRGRDDFEVSPSVQVAIDGDLEAARNMVRMGLVLYFGGMGSRKTNFYVDLAHRFGFGEVADEVQELFQAGDKEKAFQAVPDEVVNAVSLIGSEEEVAERLKAFTAKGVDRLIATPIDVDHEARTHTVERLAAIAG
ncbi:MAG: LLM class flavin-dependent oxidoreductase [Solirubrobacterales bacterium]